MIYPLKAFIAIQKILKAEYLILWRYLYIWLSKTRSMTSELEYHSSFLKVLLVKTKIIFL